MIFFLFKEALLRLTWPGYMPGYRTEAGGRLRHEDIPYTLEKTKKAKQTRDYLTRLAGYSAIHAKDV